MADDVLVSPPRIGVVLPWRESFGLQKSGAVALCARDFARFSRFAVDILGAGDCEYSDVAYRRLTDWRRFGRRDRDAYAEAVAGAGSAYGLIEAQNRPYLIPALRRRLPHVKLALHLHNDPQTMDGSRSPRDREKLLAACDAVYCVSEFVRGRWREGIADVEDKTHVVPNGAALPVTQVEKKPIVAFTGRVAAIKGVVELVRAFAAADLPGWRLIVAGGDPDGLLDRLAHERAALGPRFEPLGQVSHDVAMALLARAEIAAVPSIWDEPFGRAAIEAMANGAALIASRRGALPEVCGPAALYVDPADTFAFAAALRRLTEDADLRRESQAAGRARASARFEIKTATARLDAVREQLLARP